jgi:hypothetical protein
MDLEGLRKRALQSLRTKKEKPNHNNSCFTDKNHLLYDVMKELVGMKQVPHFCALLKIPQANQYAELVSNPKLLSQVREQIFFLLSGGLSWSQLLLMGLDQSVQVAFAAEFPQFNELEGFPKPFNICRH